MASGVADAFARIWLADGTTAEPASWQTWDYAPGQSARSGYAGIAAGTGNGLAEFEVDYILIKASGLPSIRVSPQAFPAYTPGPPSVTRNPSSQTVDEGQSASFSFDVDGTPPYRFQWFKNNSATANETNQVLNLSRTSGADNGARFKATVQTALGTVTTTEAILTVRPDTVAPALISVANSGTTSVKVIFTEPVQTASALAPGNYVLNNGAVVTGAAASSDAQTVVLTTSSLNIGTAYRLTVNNVKDQASAPNTIAANSSLTFTAAPAQTPGVLRQVYSGLSGTGLSDLTSAPAFPNSPTSENVISDFFEAPTDVDENYGQRLMALISPPATGNYTFWIASDDESALYLSTDETPANKSVIARVPGWTPSRNWTVYAEQKSAALSLQSGKRYYIEALMKEGGGGDNLAVRWQLPNGTMEEPIPASRLSVYGLGPPSITQQPANPTVVEGANAVFTVQATRTIGLTYQWLRNGANIPEATNASHTIYGTALSDNGSRYRCILVNSQGAASSTEATLTVIADATPPALVSVSNLGDATVLTVLFSEPVEAASALLPGNYTLSSGISVLGASFAGDYQTLALRTSPMASDTTYTLTVNRIRDRASTPNTIAPNTQKTFTLTYTPLDISYVKGASEPIGPSNRRTGLVLAEIMYHPAPRGDGRNLEFVELFNSNDWPEDISGYRLTGSIDYTFPSNTTMAARSYLVVAAVPADINVTYGLANVHGPWANNLPNDEGTIQLRNRIGGLFINTTYSADRPFPAAADGAGHSLVLARPSVSVSGRASSSVLYVYLDAPGNAYLDDLKLVAGGTPEVGANLIKNGDFETVLSGPWTVSPNHADSALTSGFKHSGKNSLSLVASTGGTTRSSSLCQEITPALTSDAEYTLSFWYLPGTNNVNLMVRLSGNGIISSNNLAPLPNHPPTLAPLPDFNVKFGEFVAFSALASDPDSEQSLSFSLDAGAPAGATITPE